MFILCVMSLRIIVNKYDISKKNVGYELKIKEISWICKL